MTALDDSPEKTTVDSEELQVRNRLLMMIIMVLSVIVIGFAIWTVIEATSGMAVPSEVSEVINDYVEAWEDRDSAAFRAVTTDDFVINEYQYRRTPDGVTLYEVVNDDVEGVLSIGFLFPWEVEQVGDMTVVGEDPWIVTVEENWAQNLWHYDGTATYVVIDDGGVLKVANHYWAGLAYNELQVDLNDT